MCEHAYPLPWRGQWASSCADLDTGRPESTVPNGTLYLGWRYTDRRPFIHCCCLTDTSLCSVTESCGGGVLTSVSDYSEPRICRLLLQIYYSCPPCLPLPSLDSPPREIPPPALSADTARHASVWDHLPTWAPSVSIPEYRSHVVSPQGLPLT